MLNDVRASEIDQFLDGVARLGVDDFARVGKRAIADYPRQKPVLRLMRLGAADFSHLNKRVTALTVQILPDSVVSPSESYTVNLSDAIADVMGAVQAIIKREKLTVEQYEAFVGGFRTAGATVPDHPSLNKH